MMSNYNILYKKEKGMVLATALVFITLLGILGSVAYVVTSTDLKITGNYKTSIQAFYASEAGLEEVRERLRLLPSDSNILKDPIASYNPMWSAYILTSSSWQTTHDPHYNSENSVIKLLNCIISNIKFNERA